MNSRLVGHAPEPRDGGFILVGVAMLVLALTILGLSLFSLSGYEAQFWGQSLRRSQTFYDAVGGIDRTLHVLSATSNLGDAALNLPPGIVYARAMQGDGSSSDDSLAAVDWGDTTPDGYIKVRVVSSRGGESRRVEAWYSPQRGTLYEDVIASTGRIFLLQIPNADPDLNETNNVFAMHHLRQNDPDVSSWAPPIIMGPPTYTIGGVPDPRVDDFVAYWSPQSSGPPTYDPSPPNNSPTGHNYGFTVPAGAPYGIFSGPSLQVGFAPKSEFGLSDGCSGSEAHVAVSGGKPVVWLLPGGAHFEQAVRISGGSGDRLIIVAKATSDTTFKSFTGSNLGLWFRGGLESNIPVFVVSDGAVAVDRLQAWDQNLACNDVAIFAAGVYLRGPRSGSSGRRQTLNDLNSGIINPLRDQHLLPNTLPGDNIDFKIVNGSFSDVPIQYP